MNGPAGAHDDPSASRDRILSRVREAMGPRAAVEHPGAFGGWRPIEPGAPVEAFEAHFRLAGGETQRASSEDDAAAWIARFAVEFASIAVGRGVADGLRPPLPEAPPSEAELAISSAWGAVAETGSILLDARDGRRTQLLAPTHVVLVRAATVHATLADALAALRHDLPSAVGLHSGPSKSADIGQVMVRGVHGPGRIVALLVDRLD